MRTIFVSGYLISFIMAFVPTLRIKSGFFRPEQVLSLKDIIQLLFEGGQTATEVLLGLFVLADIAFVVLAMKYPKRWVFLSGAILAAFGLFMNLFSPKAEGAELLVVPTAISLIAGALPLIGFVMNPPLGSEREHKTAFCSY